MNHYDIYDWDVYGRPGEFLFGDNVPYQEFDSEELWKPINDFHHDYWVSNMGRVYSIRTEWFVYGTPLKAGHIDISFKYGDSRYHRYLHRLVAEAFIPNPNNYPLVRHLDDDPSNNIVDNLAWGTQLDNMHDCISNGNFRRFTDRDRNFAMQKKAHENNCDISTWSGTSHRKPARSFSNSRNVAGVNKRYSSRQKKVCAWLGV